MTEKKLQLSEERSGDRTLEGSIPGSVSTSGQFQVYTKMSINSMKEEQRKVAQVLNKIEDQIAACETGLIKTLRADEEQQDILVDLQKKVAEQGEFVSIMKDRNAMALKLITAIGGGLISVIGSLLVWMLTKG